MPLQTQEVVLIGLGLEGDAPPNAMQPPLSRGVHLRWAFRRDRGFPWFGFYLFRRPSRGGDPICLLSSLGQRKPQRLPDLTLNFPAGDVESDAPLILTDDFPPSGFVEFDLENRRYLRFHLPFGSPARQAVISIGFRSDGVVILTGLSLGVPFHRIRVRGRAGQIVKMPLDFSLITGLELSRGPASLVDVCVIPVDQGANSGWTPVPKFPQAMGLPVLHPNYPCNGQRPIDEAASEEIALSRVAYGDPGLWAGTPFQSLHGELLHLVMDGPGGPTMASRSVAVTGQASPPDPAVPVPLMPSQRPLDLVLLASLHAAVSEMLGLAWVDRDVATGEAYDYLLLEDDKGIAKFDPNLALAEVTSNGFANFQAYILFDQSLQPPVLLPPPIGLKVYALPGGTVTLPGGSVRDVSNLAGLRWDRGLSGSGLLQPGQSVMYHVWRAELGDAVPAAVPGDGTFEPITKGGPILIGDSILKPGPSPAGSPDWPPFPLFAQDAGMPDGWYAYRINGIDIFGRHTPNGADAVWMEWAPLPDPRPWYFVDPPGDTKVHPFAVRLLDKIPPPPPTGIEVYALDPADPYVRQDAAFLAWKAALAGSAWYQALSAGARRNLIGLRVRWVWTQFHQRQAPDTREFRLYFSPGTMPPTPDSGIATNWSARIGVVGFNEHVETGRTDAGGNPMRIYEIFLPEPSGPVHDGLPLVVTLAEPLVYAHVGVSAVDDKAHTGDAPKWAAGMLGGRFGNEGRVGVPSKIVRVLRETPPPPVPPPDSERVFATPADYHGRSYYTYRWKPNPNLSTHVFRALDETVFRIDRSSRPRPALGPGDGAPFPSEAVEPRWNLLKRQQVAAELNALNGFGGDAAGALAAYRKLSNDGLRVLANLPGNDRAFTQLTILPLDPGDPAIANRVGPDNAAGFVVDPSLRALTDVLDGRTRSRYFYRSANVDGVHNRSVLGQSGPPIWLPKVVPPRAPAWTRVISGERSIALRWASNREPDLAAYRVYRSESEADTRDLRLMTLVQTVAVPAGDPSARPAEVPWVDTPVPGLVTFYYRLAALDDAGNVSDPSPMLAARAFDEALPAIPALSASWSTPAPPAQAVLAWMADEETLLERRDVQGLVWDPVGTWRVPGTYTLSLSLDATFSWMFRLRVRKATGAQVAGARVRLNHL